MKLFEYVQSGDYKGEKHVPVIEAPETVEAGQLFEIKASVGKEIAHPNKPEHHIVWIKLFYLPEGSKLLIELGNFEFSAHGAAMDITAQGPAKAEPTATIFTKIEKPGTIYALSYCNIHGLWESSKEIKIK
ncbi:MAG: class II SORL domain-containing protein [Synergistaceae bacterium]